MDPFAESRRTRFESAVQSESASSQQRVPQFWARHMVGLYWTYTAPMKQLRANSLVGGVQTCSFVSESFRYHSEPEAWRIAHRGITLSPSNQRPMDCLFWSTRILRNPCQTSQKTSCELAGTSGAGPVAREMQTTAAIQFRLSTSSGGGCTPPR